MYQKNTNLLIKIIISQPKWLIDEKARIFRNIVWLNPLKEPKRADSLAAPAIKLKL